MTSIKKYRRIGVGVIWDRDRQRILIDRRLPEGELAGYWEFPGGKIEPDENVEDCIKRELQEELAIEVEVGDHLITILTFPVKYEFGQEANLGKGRVN